MRRFAAGEVHVLVSTTVVEVGVDVPNATVMVVEHAERFGLAQLHQLRGRIGRGAHASTCVLLYETPWSDEAQGAAVGDGRVRGRVRARGTRPGAARPGRRLRHPAVGHAAAARRRPGARCRPARAGPSRGARPGRRRRRAGGAGRARARIWQRAFGLVLVG